MSDTRVDVVLVGAGAMGSATAWHLARRGRSVALLERFQPAHDRGSSHGASRIFRLAYADPLYVDLARRAGEGWRDLEDDSGETLLDVTGGLDHGDEQAVVALGAALTTSGVAHEVVPAQAAAERWPGMRFEGDVVVQPDAGRCRSAAAVAALQRRAADHGAEVRFATQVEAVVPDGDGVVVQSGFDVWRAPCAVIATGAWLGGASPGLPPLEVTQEQVLHFAPAADDSTHWPSFIHHAQPFVYGLETPGEGVKVAEHHTGPVVADPDARPPADPAAARRVSAYVERFLPGLVPEPVTATTCLYTTTATEDFVLDRVGPVIVASPCSGHGFKFAPEIGRLLADMAMGGPPPIERFTMAAHAAAGRADIPTGHR